MKKLTCFIGALFLSVLLTNCSSTKPTSDTSFSDPNPPFMNFPGTEWGMTPEEVCSALSIDQAEFPEADNSNVTAFGTNMTLFEADDAYVVFSFEDQNQDGVPTLSRIQVLYPASTDMEVVKTAMTDRYGDPAENTAVRAVWNAEVCHQDIMSEKDIAFIKAQNSTAQRILTTPVTTIVWTTESYPSYTRDGGTTGNLLIFDSSVSFYTQEGGFASYGEQEEPPKG